jgi:hypothetical protein
MNKPLLFCTSLSFAVLTAGSARAEGVLQISVNTPDPPGYVCIKKTVGNGKGSKEVKVCTPVEKRHEPTGKGKV